MKTRTLYKLTDENMRTYNGFAWELNKTYSTDGKGDLCGPGWLHAYTDPLLAVFLNPIHADFAAPRLFKARGSGRHKNDRGLKCGVTQLRLVKELPLPAVTMVQGVAFGILCAKAVCRDKTWNKWADAWLSGVDRSDVAAARAAYVAYAADAADAAAYAAYAAADAARAAYAADAAAYAADAAARAAAKPLNLKKLAKQALLIAP